jgi:hypothetical protein
MNADKQDASNAHQTVYPKTIQLDDADLIPPTIHPNADAYADANNMLQRRRHVLYFPFSFNSSSLIYLTKAFLCTCHELAPTFFRDMNNNLPAQHTVHPSTHKYTSTPA